MNPITLPVSELKPALTGLGKIIDKRRAVSGLDCIRLERTGSGRIELAATDLETSAIVRLETPAQGEPVAFLVPHEELSKVTKSCDRGDNLIVAPLDGDAVAIRFPVGGQIIEHRCQSASMAEFPAVAPVPGEAMALDADLKKSFGEALSCASTDPTRLVINGLFLDVSGEGHYVVGTDGRQLFSSNSFRLPLGQSLIIPNHPFLGWKDFINDGDWRLRAAFDDNLPGRFEIASTHWRFIARAWEGTYPNWRAVIPDTGARTSIQIDPAAVVDVLRTISQIPDHDSEHHTLGLEVTGTRCAVFGKSGGREGWTRIELSQAKARGADVRILLNRHLLAKALRLGLHRIEIHDPRTPVRFSNGGKQLIVMPLFEPGVTTVAPPVETSQPKEPPMSETTTEPVEQKPAIELAFSQLETLKTLHREAIRAISELTDHLRQVVRDQRTTEKEVQSIRQTLRSLQGVRI